MFVDGAQRCMRLDSIERLQNAMLHCHRDALTSHFHLRIAERIGETDGIKAVGWGS